MLKYLADEQVSRRSALTLRAVSSVTPRLPQGFFDTYLGLIGVRQNRHVIVYAAAVLSVSALTLGSPAMAGASTSQSPHGNPTATHANTSACSTGAQKVGKSKTVCLSATKGTKKDVKRADVLNAAHESLNRKQPRVAPHDVPGVCAQGYSNPDRFTSCSDEQWTITETETVDGETTVTGTLPVDVVSSAQFGTDDTADWTLSTILNVGTGVGTLEGGVAGDMSTGCGHNPDVCEITTGGAEPVDLTSDTTILGEWDEIDVGPARSTNNTVDDLTGYIGVVLDLTGPAGDPFELNDAGDNSLWGRCDTVNPGFDCVDPLASIAVAFDATTNPKIGPVADHVYTAEATLPSHWGNPNIGQALTRTTNETVIDANRAAACANVPPSCDEYPMASTNQGAATTPPGDWSAVTVPASANNSQGGILNNFYSFYRVIDDDQFYVLAVRADGSRSW
ncbi:NucA/NucB deoxyribonuclease domain-containing protein [Kutzneria buriramensis]|uniref:NucA/NucB deoxyribonuclease domain-containing protein n=1 Tax=Kutzneria buriramensis TaxID=1045776 RepID=UPI0011C1A93D|nr:NucA/NucB deoxyribonuclease domain-containing protein [Kutzneria buriramensis]